MYFGVFNIILQVSISLFIFLQTFLICFSEWIIIIILVLKFFYFSFIYLKFAIEMLQGIFFTYLILHFNYYTFQLKNFYLVPFFFFLMYLYLIENLYLVIHYCLSFL